MPDINDFETNINHLQINQSRIDDITLREENFETSSQRNLAFDGELGVRKSIFLQKIFFFNFSLMILENVSSENKAIWNLI